MIKNVEIKSNNNTIHPETIYFIVVQVLEYSKELIQNDLITAGQIEFEFDMMIIPTKGMNLEENIKTIIQSDQLNDDVDILETFDGYPLDITVNII